VLEYRSAEPRDLGSIKQLLIDSGWETRVEDPERFRQMIENASRTIVALDGERVVGFARALTDGVSNGYIGTVAVVKDMRGHNIGRTVVEKLMGDDPHITWVLRAGRSDSVGFWKRLGFTESQVAMERTRIT